VVAVVEQDGKVVLVRHSYKSGWMFPGGAVDRGETPAQAILRELQEEIGLTASDPPALIGAYLRRGRWASNLILLYRVQAAAFVFTPSWEVRELILADPTSLPAGASPASKRRIAEIYGGAPASPLW
jgi:ADP-ribose pyrophosphatase